MGPRKISTGQEGFQFQVGLQTEQRVLMIRLKGIKKGS
jgi:hypothetical protein